MVVDNVLVEFWQAGMHQVIVSGGKLVELWLWARVVQ